MKTLHHYYFTAPPLDFIATWSQRIRNLSLNITSIQFSTVHDCFIQVFLFRWEMMAFVFCFTFLYVNPISSRWFLEVWSDTDSSSICSLFVLFKTHGFKFSILALWCHLWSIALLPFYNFPMLFVLNPDFRHTWLGTTSFFSMILQPSPPDSAISLVIPLFKVWALINRLNI